MNERTFIFSHREPVYKKEAVLFRKEFIYRGQGGTVLGITADTRYQLFVNGRLVCRGPESGDRFRQYYDEVDLREFLVEGKNCIAVRVIHYPAGEEGLLPFAFGPTGRSRSLYGGLCVFPAEDGVLPFSDETWRWAADASYGWKETQLARQAGDMERIDARRFPHGWTQAGYDDSAWQDAVTVQAMKAGESASPYGVLANWILQKRDIPMMEETPVAPAAIRKEEDGRIPAGRIQTGRIPAEQNLAEQNPAGQIPTGQNPAAQIPMAQNPAEQIPAGQNPAGQISAGQNPAAPGAKEGAGADSSLPFCVPPHTTAVYVIDMGRLCNVYVRSRYREGGGASAEYLYSECYYEKTADGLVKGQRDDEGHGVLSGESDELRLGEGAFVYEPFEYRTFRYLRLTIAAGEQPVVLESISFWETGYPFHPKAGFRAQQVLLEKIWEVSLHTLRCCMQDTYLDCPYYERLQYVMDTMIEARHTYPLTGDDRLARKALQDFAGARLPDGMIYCNAPANDKHVIPGFGIYFIDMLYEHYLYYGDRRFTRRYLPVCAGILQFFEDHTDPGTGLATECGYWEFVDWTKEWNPFRGEPADRSRGEKQYIYSMMYAYGLSLMAELTDALQGKEAAGYWRERQVRVWEAVYRQARTAGGYYKTSDRAEKFSEHAQVWAILGGFARGMDARRLAGQMLADDSLVTCSYSMRHYFNKALEIAGKAGLEPDCLPMWEEYAALLKRGVTTWPEEPVSPRSECHGWSTIPIYEICHVLLGVQPDQPGFASLLIEPKYLQLGSMKGSVWTPRGMVEVERTILPDDDGAFTEEVYESQEMPEVSWPEDRASEGLEAVPAGEGSRLRLRIRTETDLPVKVRVEGREVWRGICRRNRTVTVLWRLKGRGL